MIEGGRIARLHRKLPGHGILPTHSRTREYDHISTPLPASFQPPIKTMGENSSSSIHCNLRHPCVISTQLISDRGIFRIAVKPIRPLAPTAGRKAGHHHQNHISAHTHAEHLPIHHAIRKANRLPSHAGHNNEGPMKIEGGTPKYPLMQM